MLKLQTDMVRIREKVSDSIDSHSGRDRKHSRGPPSLLLAGGILSPVSWLPGA